MHPSSNNFWRALITEISLLIIFLTASLCYAIGVIPQDLLAPILVPIVVLGLIPILKSTLESLRNKTVNVDLLASIALLFSLFATEWGSVLFINLMLIAARFLDLYTRRRIHTSLESLMKLKPSHARIKKDGVIKDIPLEQVISGDLVVVNLGEQIPVDGYIITGSASVNQASLTGESLPVLKEVGDLALSATTIVSGNLIIRAERIGRETTFERMVRLVESSQAVKARMKTLGERFASAYIIITLIASALLYFYTYDIKLVLAVILVVCADDIAIAIPVAYIAGLGTAAKRGILVKGADFLERAASIHTLIVDKTGTLTMGNLAVKKVHTFEGTDLSKLLNITGSICERSTHPVARAILQYTKDHYATIGNIDSFKETEGRGIEGIFDGKNIIIGRPEYLWEQGVYMGKEAHDAIDQEAREGKNATLVSLEGKVIGLFASADELRPNVKDTIEKMRQRGVEKVMMLTGDNQNVARMIAEHAGIDTYYAGLLPENKVTVLEKNLIPGKTVAMVGDGVNDAAVLTRADLGIAMGGIGSDAAIDSADVVLMNDDLSKVVELQTIARRVMDAARINFAIWGVVNVIGLYLVFTRVFGPAEAAAYNFLTDFLPIINSMRLFRYKE